MLRRNVPLPSFEGVAAGSTATLNVPRSGTYYQIDLEYRRGATLATEAQFASDITEIRLLIDGKTIRRHSAQDIIDLCKHYGVPFSAGYVHLFFWEPWADNAQSQEIFVLGTNNTRSITIEVDIAGGATSPALKAIAKKTAAPNDLGTIRKIRKFQVAVAGTGLLNYQTLPTQDSYKALHLKSTDIDDVEVIVNTAQVFKETADNMAAVLNSNPKLDHVTGFFHVDFDEACRLEDFLPMTNYIVYTENGQLVRKNDGAIGDFQLNINMNAANNFTLLAETIGMV